MCECLSAHIGKQTLEVLEENFTPDNYKNYLENEKYHASAKGCECEMFSIDTLGQNKLKGLIINKRCKTHNVVCSKSGWEIGWFQGTETDKIKKYLYDGVCKCGRHFINNTPLKLGLCPYCFKKESTEEEWNASQKFKKKLNNKFYRDKYRKEHNIPLDQEVLKKRLNNIL